MRGTIWRQRIRYTVTRVMAGKWVLGALLIAMLAFHQGGGSVAIADTPNLPPQYQSDAPDRLTLLNFFSPFCQTCQMMEPHVNRLAQRLSSRLAVHAVDVLAAEHEKLADSFQIDSTPSYILFNSSGQAVYRMSGLVSPAILERQVLRALDALEPVEVPDSLPLPEPENARLDSASGSSGLILLAFEGPDCEDCQGMKPYLTGFQLAEQEGFHLFQVDAGQSEGQRLMESLAIPRLPAYVLLDNNRGRARQRGELFRVVGNIPPKALWDLVRIFSQSGV